MHILYAVLVLDRRPLERRVELRLNTTSVKNRPPHSLRSNPRPALSHSTLRVAAFTVLAALAPGTCSAAPAPPGRHSAQPWPGTLAFTHAARPTAEHHVFRSSLTALNRPVSHPRADVHRDCAPLRPAFMGRSALLLGTLTHTSRALSKPTRGPQTLNELPWPTLFGVAFFENRGGKAASEHEARPGRRATHARAGNASSKRAAQAANNARLAVGTPSAQARRVARVRGLCSGAKYGATARRRSAAKQQGWAAAGRAPVRG